jgi:hypothetical protein
MLVRAVLQAVAGARARRRPTQAGRGPRPAATLSDQLRAEERRQRERERDARGRRP